MVFKFSSEAEIREMRIGAKPIEDIIAESKTLVKIPKTSSLLVDVDYINKSLLYDLAYTSYDNDGYEYPYNLFDLAQDPSIIDKITNL
jgi:hypothetical protein